MLQVADGCVINVQTGIVDGVFDQIGDCLSVVALAKKRDRFLEPQAVLGAANAAAQPRQSLRVALFG